MENSDTVHGQRAKSSPVLFVIKLRPQLSARRRGRENPVQFTVENSACVENSDTVHATMSHSPSPSGEHESPHQHHPRYHMMMMMSTIYPHDRNYAVFLIHQCDDESSQPLAAYRSSFVRRPNCST